MFLFIVDIEGEKRAVEYYSKARKILTLQTLYGWKNRKSLSVTSDAIAPDRTPKTTNGFNSSVDIISTEGENGNSIAESSQFNFSENAPAKRKSRVNDEEYFDAVENEYDLLLEDLVLEAAKEGR